MIDKDRERHIFGVAMYMFNHAKWYGLDPFEMYFLGILHDVGYLQEDIEHSDFGGCLAESLGFKYANEVKLHSTPPSLLESKGIEVSDELALLYEADLKVDAYGNEVGYTKRLEDIKKRHGVKSEAYKNSCKTIEWLRGREKY